MTTIFERALFGFASVTATAAMVAFSAPAAAALGETSSATVQVADLNLSSPLGRETATRRIRSAVREVCGSDDQRDAINCRTRAASAAMTALHRYADDQAQAPVASLAAR